MPKINKKTEMEERAAESSGSWKVGDSIRKHPIAFIIILAYYEFPVLAIMGLAPPGEWIGLLLIQFAKAWLFTWVLAAIVGRLRGKESTEGKQGKESKGEPMFKCDLCGATFSQSKGADGCPECYSSDISEV